MDSKEITSIDQQVKMLIDNIKKLQTEIKTYQTGYEAFTDASRGLSNLASGHEDLVKTIKTSVANLENLDAVAMAKKIDESSEKILAADKSINDIADQLSSVTLKLTESLEKINVQLSAVAAAHEKSIREANAATAELIKTAETKITELFKQTEASCEKLIANAESQMMTSADKSIEGIKKITSEMSVKVKDMDSDIKKINTTLTEGVKVKKRFF